MDIRFAVLSSLLIQLPIILVWLVGVALSLVFWRRHPTVSAMTLIAFIGFLIVAIIGTYLNTWLPITLQQRGLTAGRIGTILAVTGIINALVHTCLWVLVTMAIFGWRKKQEPLQ
jgi:hypothetical protein